MKELKPQGYRDLWWCYILNEPVITDYDSVLGQSKLHCSCCDMTTESAEPDEPFLAQHMFIRHVKKP